MATNSPRSDLGGYRITNPWVSVVSLNEKWGLDYIKGTYGSPCGAWSHEEATGWY